MFVYCEKCGFITGKKITNCIVCETEMKNVPGDYLSPSGFMFISAESRGQFENFIKQSNTYDSEIAANRDNILKQREEEHKAATEKKLEQYNETRFKIQCPVCKSESLEKISNLGKVLKISAIGVFGAGDLGKSYRCKVCGHRF